MIEANYIYMQDIASDKKSLRVGVLLDSIVQPAWILWIIEEIIRMNEAELSFVVLNKGMGNSVAKEGFASKLFKGISILERKLVKGSLAEFERRKISIPNSAILIEDVPVKKGIGLKLSDDSIEAIRELNPDIIIRFGFGILRGEILNIPKHGVWSFHHGDNRIARGRPACFWEIRNNEHIIGAVLQILNEELDNGKIIDRVYSKVINNSVWLSMNQLYKTAKQMVPNKIRHLYKIGTITSKDFPVLYDRPLYKYPGVIDTIDYSFKLLKGKLDSKLGKQRKRNWSVFVGITKNGQHPLSFPLFKLRRLPTPQGKFWADPFIRNSENGFEVFLEEYCLEREKGYIKKVTLDIKGEVVSQAVCLEEDWHLSYPFLIQKDGEWYMIPEASVSGMLTIYKENKLTYKWEPVRTLFKSEAVFDCTICKVEDVYWIFMTKKGVSERSDAELYIYHTHDFVNDIWEEHSLNPVKIDMRSARPAGAIINIDGKLYRPSQDCSTGYGSRIIINEIETVTKDAYQERMVDMIEANWRDKLNAVHTVNSCKNAVVYDANIK
jgi:hypothetical protein